MCVRNDGLTPTPADPASVRRLPARGLQIACDGSNINPVAIALLQVKLPDGSYYIPGSGTSGAVQRVGGNRLAVTGLMGAGVDPHLYTPTLGDRMAMQKADLIFYNGLHLEGKMGDTFEKLGPKAVAVTGATLPGSRP